MYRNSRFIMKKDSIQTILKVYQVIGTRSLLNRPGDVGFDNNFYNVCIKKKDGLEQNNPDITPELNVPITLRKYKYLLVN